MIYTVTFNPSMDYIVSVDDFKLGLTNRTSSELMLPGGKGINVSTVLMNLGIENTALGFTAGFVGEEIIRRLQEMGVRSEFIQISEGVSRINLKLKSIDGTEINGAGPVISKDKVEELMKKLGISEIAENDINEVSGGQLQRACICRSLINQPKMIFADEPTGALNQQNSKEVMKELNRINAEGTTVMLVTHDMKVAAKSDRVLYIEDGNIKGELSFGKMKEHSEIKERERKISNWLMEMGF